MRFLQLSALCALYLIKFRLETGEGEGEAQWLFLLIDVILLHEGF